MVKNYKFMGLMATVLVVTGLAALAATAGIARADNSTTVTAWAYSPVVTQVTGVARVKQVARLNGKIQVMFIMAHGLPKSQRQRCEWGDFAWSNWRTSTGGIVWAPTGHHGRTHACWDGHVWRQVGGGPGQWNCGNIVVPMGHLPRHAVKVKLSQIVVVKHFTFTWKLTLRSFLSATVSAWAQCHVGTESEAVAYAYASGWASIAMNFTATAQTMTQATAIGAKVMPSQSQYQTLVGQAQTSARLNLSAAASATCNGSAPPTPSTPPGSPTPPPPTPPTTCPPNFNGTPPHCVKGKDGTQGPGSGTPGQPGGTGAGGSPGSGSGPMCRDASGNLVPGTPDSNGNCPGVSSSGTTGTSGSASGSPPPPPPSMCIDPATGQEVQGTPDQFGYCT